MVRPAPGPGSHSCHSLCLQSIHSSVTRQGVLIRALLSSKVWNTPHRSSEAGSSYNACARRSWIRTGRTSDHPAASYAAASRSCRHQTAAESRPPFTHTTGGHSGPSSSAAEPRSTSVRPKGKARMTTARRDARRPPPTRHVARQPNRHRPAESGKDSCRREYEEPACVSTMPVASSHVRHGANVGRRTTSSSSGTCTAAMPRPPPRVAAERHSCSRVAEYIASGRRSKVLISALALSVVGEAPDFVQTDGCAVSVRCAVATRTDLCPIPQGTRTPAS